MPGWRAVKNPKQALANHGVISPSGRNEFKLSVNMDDLSAESRLSRQELIAICKEKLSKAKH